MFCIGLYRESMKKSSLFKLCPLGKKWPCPGVHMFDMQDPVAQSVVSLIADPGVVSWIPGRLHTYT